MVVVCFLSFVVVVIPTHSPLPPTSIPILVVFPNDTTPLHTHTHTHTHTFVSQRYAAACAKFGRTVNPDGIVTYDGPNWWESPEFQEMTNRQKAQSEQLAKEEKKSERQMEVEKVAKAWMQREYFRMSMAGKLNGMTEEQFEIKMWKKALKEGEKRYQVYLGEVPDENGEIKLNSERRMKKIEEVMLERARAEMRQLLEEEGENFDDVKGFDEMDDLDGKDKKKKKDD